MMILNRHLAIKVVCINRSHEKALRLAVTNEKKNLSPFINCLKRQNCDHTLEESPDTSRKKINLKQKKINPSKIKTIDFRWVSIYLRV